MPDYTSSQFDANQFNEAQNKAYSVLAAICGPEVAIAFARYYGKNITPDQIVNTAREFGLWSTNTGMRGPQAQKQLMDKLGIPAQYSPEVNQNAIQQTIAQGGLAAVSTPGHYFTLQGYNPQTGQYDTGQSGRAFKGGGQYLTLQQMQALGGTAQGQFLSQGGPSEAPSPQSIDYNNKELVKQYIRYAAAHRGIDPDIAVRVAESEGLNTYVGDQGSSFGPYQLHYGNVAGGGNSVGGLGDTFTQRTGLNARDPNTIQAQIDFVLDQAKTGGWGPWHGAQALGLSPYQGIGTFQGDPSQYPIPSLTNSLPSNPNMVGSPAPQMVTGLPNLTGLVQSSVAPKPPTGLPNLANGLPRSSWPTIQMGSQFMTPYGAMGGFSKPTIIPPQVQARTWL